MTTIMYICLKTTKSSQVQTKETLFETLDNVLWTVTIPTVVYESLRTNVTVRLSLVIQSCFGQAFILYINHTKSFKYMEKILEWSSRI